MDRDPILGRGTEFWGHETEGKNDNEKIIMHTGPKVNSKKIQE